MLRIGKAAMSPPSLYLSPGVACACQSSRFASSARAVPFDAPVNNFTTDDFSDTEEAVATIAASGNPLAYPIISALHDERLMFDADTKKVYIKQTDGKAIDAETGAPADS